MSISVETVGNVKASGPPPSVRTSVPIPKTPTVPEMAALRARMRPAARPAVEVQLDVPERETPASQNEPPSEKRPPPSARVPPQNEKTAPAERVSPSEKNLLGRRSARPPAPDPFAVNPAESESIAQTFDRLLGTEVDSRFGEIKQPSEKPPAAGSLNPPPSTLNELRELFGHLAANHVGPVREFVIDLRWGEASCEWIPVCSSAVESLCRAAQKLAMTELEEALKTFDAATKAAAGEPRTIVEGAARERILAAYDQLAVLLPKAFALDMDRAQRESLIVQSLLLQIPEVHRVTIERLHAAGLNGIAMLGDARPHEIADTAGIPPKLAERIVEAFSAYRDERHAHPSDAIHGRERALLDKLLNELEAHHAGFEQASEGWTPQAKEAKARLRRERHKTLMEISVILARIGEIALLQRLEKLPFDRKLEGLRDYIKDGSQDGSSPTIAP